jgi:hypothetical protein
VTYALAACPIDGIPRTPQVPEVFRKVGRVGGRGQERQIGWSAGYGCGVFGESDRASGGAPGPEGSGIPALTLTLVEVVFLYRIGYVVGHRVGVVGQGQTGLQVSRAMRWSVVVSGGRRRERCGWVTDDGRDDGVGHRVVR